MGLPPQATDDADLPPDLDRDFMAIGHSPRIPGIRSAGSQNVQLWALDTRKSRKTWTRATERISSG